MSCSGLKYVRNGSSRRLEHPGAAMAAIVRITARARAPRLFQPVIGSFLGDDDVVHVTLLEPGAGDADEARLGMEIPDGSHARVAHAGAEAAHEQAHHRGERALVGH